MHKVLDKTVNKMFIWSGVWHQQFTPYFQTHSALFHALTYPENMVPDRGAPKVYVEVCVAVLDSHKAVLLDKGLREEGVVRPVVLHPGHLLSHIRNLYQL